MALSPQQQQSQFGAGSGNRVTADGGRFSLSPDDDDVVSNGGGGGGDTTTGLSETAATTNGTVDSALIVDHWATTGPSTSNGKPAEPADHFIKKRLQTDVVVMLEVSVGNGDAIEQMDDYAGGSGGNGGINGFRQTTVFHRPLAPSSATASGTVRGNGTSTRSSTADPAADSKYTIVVPANVRYRGVNMQLDLKIDEKTLVAAENLSKAVRSKAESAAVVGPVSTKLVNGDAPPTTKHQRTGGSPVSAAPTTTTPSLDFSAINLDSFRIPQTLPSDFLQTDDDDCDDGGSLSTVANGPSFPPRSLSSKPSGCDAAGTCLPTTSGVGSCATGMTTTLSANVLRKTGGINPRDLLAEKLKRQANILKRKKPTALRPTTSLESSSTVSSPSSSTGIAVARTASSLAVLSSTDPPSSPPLGRPPTTLVDDNTIRTVAPIPAAATTAMSPILNDSDSTNLLPLAADTAPLTTTTTPALAKVHSSPPVAHISAADSPVNVSYNVCEAQRRSSSSSLISLHRFIDGDVAESPTPAAVTADIIPSPAVPPPPPPVAVASCSSSIDDVVNSVGSGAATFDDGSATAGGTAATAVGFGASTVTVPSKKTKSSKPQSQNCIYTERRPVAGGNIGDTEEKACRQRAIVGYKFCIRHILADNNAPYMACHHRRKPKSKLDTNLQCTNAIRRDKEVPYCSTHMIMMGMLEPKKKGGNLQQQMAANAAKAKSDEKIDSATATPQMDGALLGAPVEPQQMAAAGAPMMMVPGPPPPNAAVGYDGRLVNGYAGGFDHLTGDSGPPPQQSPEWAAAVMHHQQQQNRQQAAEAFARHFQQQQQVSLPQGMPPSSQQQQQQHVMYQQPPLPMGAPPYPPHMQYHHNQQQHQPQMQMMATTSHMVAPAPHGLMSQQPHPQGAPPPPNTTTTVFSPPQQQQMYISQPPSAASATAPPPVSSAGPGMGEASPLPSPSYWTNLQPATSSATSAPSTTVNATAPPSYKQSVTGAAQLGQYGAQSQGNNTGSPYHQPPPQQQQLLTMNQQRAAPLLDQKHPQFIPNYPQQPIGGPASVPLPAPFSPNNTGSAASFVRSNSAASAASSRPGSTFSLPPPSHSQPLPQQQQSASQPPLPPPQHQIPPGGMLMNNGQGGTVVVLMQGQSGQPPEMWKVNAAQQQQQQLQHQQSMMMQHQQQQLQAQQLSSTQQPMLLQQPTSFAQNGPAATAVSTSSSDLMRTHPELASKLSLAGALAKQRQSPGNADASAPFVHAMQPSSTAVMLDDGCGGAVAVSVAGQPQMFHPGHPNSYLSMSTNGVPPPPTPDRSPLTTSVAPPGFLLSGGGHHPLGGLPPPAHTPVLNSSQATSIGAPLQFSSPIKTPSTPINASAVGGGCVTSVVDVRAAEQQPIVAGGGAQLLAASESLPTSPIKASSAMPPVKTPLPLPTSSFQPFVVAAGPVIPQQIIDQMKLQHSNLGSSTGVLGGAGSASQSIVINEQGKKMIRLKPLSRKLKMIGKYRRIPMLNDMCKIVEEWDFDRQDLFPLGLEPESGDEGDSTAGSEGGTGGLLAEENFAERLLAMNEAYDELVCHPQPSGSSAVFPPYDSDEIGGEFERSARRQLYLVKKQLRLERLRLLREARQSMPVIQAAKYYPNSVGRALLDRSRRRVARRKLKLARKTLERLRLRDDIGLNSSTAGGLHGTTTAAVGKSHHHHSSKKKTVDGALVDRDPSLAGPLPAYHDPSLRERRCCYVDRVSRGGQCHLAALPFSNHCAGHVLYNVAQLPFRYCAETNCQQPVLDLGMESYQVCGDRCRHHLVSADLVISGNGFSADDDADTKKKKRYPSQKRPRKRKRPTAKANTDKSMVDGRDSSLAESRGSSAEPPIGALLGGQPPSFGAVLPSSSSVPLPPISINGNSGLSLMDISTNRTTVPTVASVAPRAAVDGDVSLMKELELGLEDHELTEMLNRIPDEAFTSLMSQDIGRNGDHASMLGSALLSGSTGNVAAVAAAAAAASISAVNGVPSIPTSEHSAAVSATHSTSPSGACGGGGGELEPFGVGHSWADVEQFLMSEGYRGGSFSTNGGGDLLPPIGTTIGAGPGSGVGATTAVSSALFGGYSVATTTQQGGMVGGDGGHFMPLPPPPYWATKMGSGQQT